jgi:hypothetical protein
MFTTSACAALILCAAATLASAQGAQPQTPVRVAASSLASVEVHVNARQIGNQWYEEDASLSGPSRIAITYGQPHARGRKVEGGLIPLDTVWRFGANMMTALHTDLNLQIGTLAVPRGDYSLFILWTKNGWQLIVNRATAGWGTEYSAARDVGRVNLAVKKLAEPEESLTIYLVPESARPSEGYAELKGLLRIKWGQTELSTPWQVQR